MSGLTRVVSDKSIMVFTLLPDAAVTYIPPTNQRITHATLSPFVLTPSNITAHAVELLVPAAYWDAGLVEIREDGAAVPGSACTVTSGGSFSDWYTVRRETGNTDVTVDVSCPGSGFLAYMYGYGGAETYGYLAGAGAYNLQCYFTVKEKETNNDIYYENTSELTHTFQTGDEIVVKRTVEQTFTDIAWRINGLLYSSIAEDPSATMKTLSFPATAFRGGQNTLTMSVRFKDATADSVYTCNIWRKVVLQMNDDTRTVQKYRWTEIDVLANDVLPDGLFSPGPFSLLDSVVLPPTGGTLCASGSGRNSKLIYLNNGTNNLPGHIDSLVYRFRVNESGMLHEFRATAYIYILDEIHGASACGDRDFTATLREAPAGTGFEWYAVADPATLLHTGASHTFDMPAGEDSMLVKPGVPDAAAPWNRAGGFPPGLLAVHAAGADPRPMRWTGLVNTDWYNPANWVEQDAEGWEAPVLWPPAACTDVDIFSDVPHFPELIDSAWCRRITLHDRALFKNPHVLNYDSARVELKLKATERDRFVMWSAPLRDMYSGDYHFDGADGKPNWGDVSMNYFQRANPDNVGSVAQKNTFTATFGSPGDSLKPGLAFNLRVTSTDISRESSWTFPQPETSYTAANKTYPTPRTFPHRFITDGLEQNASGQYLLPVLNDVAYNNLVQIVNPYLAWLCIDSFLQNNKLLTSGYLIWDGRTNSGFKAVKLADNPDGMRYTYTGGTGDFIVSPKYIAPLQSFFVAKNSLVAGMGLLLSSVSMSPAWTVTNVPGSESGSYVLFASEAESGVLHVRALQGDRTAYAALQFDSRTATPEYRDHEDVRALFSDLSPLAVYVLTALREPLAISADGDYQTHTTALGLRLPESGEVRLEFTGMEGFGHDVFLVDRELDTEISLQQTDSYTFTAVKPAGASTLELNDRFALRMEYTGVGNRPAEELRPEVTVGASAGYIHVRSLTGRIDRIDVYNMPGTLVASAAPAGVNELNIPVAGAQTYLVKVET
ncbi:MAG: hypothetical protein LBP98_07825, partial [Tannerella sp.]|nr:hypothetical protein [Tannerella sp.]